MKINTNHPSFLNFINNINTTVMAHAQIDDYFSLSLDKKMNTLYVVFKLLRNTINLRTKISDEELKELIQILIKKNEEYENYEFAAALKDIETNFKIINDFVKPKRKSNKTIKVDKPKNG
jgi:hypothetical protein